MSSEGVKVGGDVLFEEAKKFGDEIFLGFGGLVGGNVLVE